MLQIVVLLHQISDVDVWKIAFFAFARQHVSSLDLLVEWKRERNVYIARDNFRLKFTGSIMQTIKLINLSLRQLAFNFSLLSLQQKKWKQKSTHKIVITH